MPRVRCPLEDCHYWAENECCAPHLDFSRRGNTDMEIGRIGDRGKMQGRCPAYRRRTL